MKALVLAEYGPEENLLYQDTATPTFSSPTQVLVRIKAAGVGAGEIFIRKGFVKLVIPMALPAILGMDYSGVIEEVGQDVQGFAVGDKVFGELAAPSPCGTYAEYVVLDTKKDAIAKMPESLTFEQAGGVGVSGITAVVGLLDLAKLDQLPAGQRVLVIGASGAVGSFGVQIAKAHGAHVTGICSAGNFEAVKNLGADVVIDYRSASFKEELGQQALFDIVLDCAGGDEYYRLVEPRINKGGIFTTACGPYQYGKLDSPLDIAKMIPFGAKLFWRGTFGFRTRYAMIQGSPVGHIHKLKAWFDEGKLKPLPIKTFPLRDGPAAHRASASLRTVGKLILVP
ncbi:hypothetical protein HDU91_000694 [Kappamyces sp. JEL0680]|nr:hypothetical protein HDU91_000694 [Kappamyces sp. JEL0680]